MYMLGKRTKVLFLMLVCVVVIAATSCTFDNQHGVDAKPVGELLRENGYEASDTGWLELLKDDQRSAIKKAYEKDKTAGYEGSQGDWMAMQLYCHTNQDGAAIIIMPDGTEFTVAPNSYFVADADDADDASAEVPTTSDNEDAKSGLPSPKEEWQPVLTDEQNAVIDMAYESSVASGYEGSRDEWLSSEVAAHYNRSGDIVVTMPDGEDFTVVTQKDNASSSNSSGSVAAKDDRSEAASSANTAGARFVVEGQKAKPGTMAVPVTVRVENNPGILGMALSVSYDPEILTLKDAESGEAVKSVLTMSHSKNLESGCVIAWDGVEIADDDVHDGAVLRLYFDVSPDAKPGVYPVTVSSEGSVVNNSLQEIEVTVQDGNVVVE